MADPLFWLALSFLLVVISLTAVLMVAIPAMRELGRAARSAEKFFDTLGRELPPTLEAIRLTGLEITELTDDVTEGVQSAGQVVQQVNKSITTAQTGAKRLNTGTKSLLTGAKAAWRVLTNDAPSPRSQNKRANRESPALSQPQSSASPAPERRRSQLEAAPDDALTPLDSGADGSEQTRDRALPGSGSVPQLDETSRRTAPEPRPEALPADYGDPEATDAPSRRWPQEVSRQANLD
ncbi:DUF948 domain-containing protein [Nodosilinea sp. LEGE 07298]|uniref:DUF948 domain-containing protein n=1 Tax=Nodosilinea sp. LEGE 07298 TaxID=2777970 RepID=UPI00187FDBBE|nr:DUF948 domain-containing protein [Nodosilinea sp. LEGE 07298]MBE9111428.1 DUF948 domain-containing protein [Nodosilinea sp. LEGE 07298]